MTSKEQILQQLIDMSRRLGEEHKGLVILGEGNTSAKISDETFYVKGSGTQLGTMTADGLVEVMFGKVLEMLDGPELSDEEIKARLKESMVEEGPIMPSIETVFHGFLLSLPGVNFVGHSHPISVNSILCSKGWRDFTDRRLFPDEVVCCGVSPVFIEYTDPGVTLARKIKESVTAFIGEYGERPKAILMQNHGLIALGGTSKEVESITAMWDKTAKVLAGTFHFGGPSYLSDANVDRIHTRPDEEQRKRLIEGMGE